MKTFNDFPLSEETKKGLAECEYETPTEIQKESLAMCLKGLDILGKTFKIFLRLLQPSAAPAAF